MRRVSLVFVVLLLVAAGGTVVYQAARERDYRTLLARGDTSLSQDQTFTAIEAYSGAIALKPGSMLAHLRRGETYWQRGELEEAVRDFRTASRLDPTAPRPLEELGDVSYELGQFDGAAESYEGYLALDDRSAPVYYKLALARYRQEAVPSTLQALEQAVALDSSFADAYYLMGVCLRDTDRREDAVNALERAITLSPGLIPAREELADLYAGQGRTAEELEQLQVIAGLDREHVERQVAVSLAHARAGDADLAVLTLGNALERTPGQPLIYEALGRVWLDIARTRDDRVALGKAIEALARVASNPSSPSEALLLYGQALLRDGQLQAAERTLQQAATREPVEPEALRAYAAVAEQLEHLESARTALIEYRVLTAEHDDVVELSHIADLSARLNDDQSATVWFGRALALAPDDVRLLAGLAEAQSRLGLLDDARAVAARALQLEPDNGRLLALVASLR